ncbi:hypothetical protein AB4376_18300 [Vibrio breoganii]
MWMKCKLVSGQKLASDITKLGYNGLVEVCEGNAEHKVRHDELTKRIELHTKTAECNASP